MRDHLFIFGIVRSYTRADGRIYVERAQK